MKYMQFWIIKLLPLLFILFFTGFVMFARSTNTLSVHEEKRYDKFGIVSHSSDGKIEINPFNDINRIKINFTAKLNMNDCELRLKPDIPDVFSPEFKIEESNVPITSDFLLVLEKDSTIKINADVEMKNFPINQEDINSLNYPNEIRTFLKAKDELFHYPVDDPEIQSIVQSFNRYQNLLELIEDIKNYTKTTLEYSQEETNEDVLYSLKTGKGDCDDYARLFITISRALEIPARPRFNSEHMWVEVLIPLKDGYRWIIVDPTESYEDVSYSLSLDVEPYCENYVVEDEVWTIE